MDADGGNYLTASRDMPEQALQGTVDVPTRKSRLPIKFMERR
jgi:hypothetical protein